MRTKLLTQVAPENRLLARLSSVGARASEAFLAVSFLTLHGAELMMDALTPMLRRGSQIEVYCSGYMRITDPKALKRLLVLAKTYENLRLFFNGERRFHAKFMLFYTENKTFTAYVGSSNLSGGGLLESGELNVEISGSRGELFFRDALVVMRNIGKMPGFKQLTPTGLEKYTTSHGKKSRADDPGTDDGTHDRSGESDERPQLPSIPVYLADSKFTSTEEDAIEAEHPKWGYYLRWDRIFKALGKGGLFIEIDGTKKKKRFAIQQFLADDNVDGAGHIAHVREGKFIALSKLAAWIGKSERALLRTKKLGFSEYAPLWKRLPNVFERDASFPTVKK